MVDLLPILVLAIIVATFGALLVVGSSFFGPKTKQSKVKLEAYECGLEAENADSSKVPIKFYLTAILFILFDIEIIFMYPWALSYGDFIREGHSIYIMSAMGVFLFVFIVGLFWEVKSKALEWE